VEEKKVGMRKEEARGQGRGEERWRMGRDEGMKEKKVEKDGRGPEVMLRRWTSYFAFSLSSPF